MLLGTKQRLRRVTLPLARSLASAGVHPDQITAAGLALSALAALCLALGEAQLSILPLLLSLLCDLLDGDVARLRPRVISSFGAFFDSTADRIAETLVFTGLILGKNAHAGGLGTLWVLLWVLALAGAYLVSYTRARAEGLGLTCRIGVADRSVRMVLVFLMLLAGWKASGYFLATLSLLSWYTVGQRIRHVRGQALRAAGPVLAAGCSSADQSRGNDSNACIVSER
ncbi:MAG: CDP-alcohol phosphatidyltransferase family protein [Candidatus Eisenbacteria bacterium]